MDICAAGDAAEDAFLLGQAAGHHKGVVIANPNALGDLIAAVLAFKMKITRNKAGSGALDLMWPGRQLIAGKRLRDAR